MKFIVKQKNKSTDANETYAAKPTPPRLHHTHTSDHFLSVLKKLFHMIKTGSEIQCLRIEFRCCHEIMGSSRNNMHQNDWLRFW